MDPRTIPAPPRNMFVPVGVDRPVSPPSYEEALQTPAPDLELGGSDEPPPSYSEATVDDEDNDAPPQCTTDQTRLIVVRVWRRVRCGIPQDQRVPAPILQTSPAHRRNRCVCLSTTLVTLICVVSVVTFLATRGDGGASDVYDINNPSYDINMPTIDPEVFKWMNTGTQSPLDTDLGNLELSNIDAGTDDWLGKKSHPVDTDFDPINSGTYQGAGTDERNYPTIDPDILKLIRKTPSPNYFKGLDTWRKHLRTTTQSIFFDDNSRKFNKHPFERKYWHGKKYGTTVHPKV